MTQKTPDLKGAVIRPAQVLLRTDSGRSVSIGDCHMCHGHNKIRATTSK